MSFGAFFCLHVWLAKDNMFHINNLAPVVAGPIPMHLCESDGPT